MYYPYFRGKQYELITIRENAQRMADSTFVPVIEPVSEPPHHRNAPLHRPSRNELSCGFVAVAQQGQGCDGFGHASTRRLCLFWH